MTKKEDFTQCVVCYSKIDVSLGLLIDGLTDIHIYTQTTTFLSKQIMNFAFTLKVTFSYLVDFGIWMFNE